MRVLALGTALVLVAALNLFADDTEHVASGTIQDVDAGAKTVTIETTEGAHTVKLSDGTTVNGSTDLASATTAAAKITALGAKKGSQAVVHYSGEGAKKTAHGVKVVGNQSVKVASGIVTAGGDAGQAVAIKTKDGSVKTFDMAGNGVVVAGRATGAGAKAQAAAKGTSHGVTTGSQVTVHYTVEGGKQVAHGIEHIFK